MSSQNSDKTKLNSIPAHFIALEDYEVAAQDYIDAPTAAYIAGGSGEENTLKANRTAFNQYSIVPRLLSDCSAGHTSLEILGQPFRHPIFLAPVAYQKLVHPHGEIETARAAQAVDACMITSTQASTELEHITSTNTGHNWFQLYFQSSREATLKLIRRAEAAGYTALVVTLDTPIQSVSRRAIRADFQLPSHASAVNISVDHTDEKIELSNTDSIIFQGMMRDAPKPEDIEWLVAATSLPVIAKGVLSPSDARNLLQLGASSLIVSNHGGRALDSSPATIDVLADIRASIGPDVPILLDSGIRSGYDIFKAIALGADAVLIGRPQMYALAVAGALGVAHMIKLLRDELELCMALAGCPTLAEINSSKISKV